MCSHPTEKSNTGWANDCGLRTIQWGMSVLRDVDVQLTTVNQHNQFID